MLNTCLSPVRKPCQCTLCIFFHLMGRGVDAYDAELDTAEVEELRAPARKGFVAVEWGGMNLNGEEHD